MTDSTKSWILGIFAAIGLFGGLGAYGYLMYSVRDQRVQCPCEMVKNKECVP
jgi:hypothetical protein